MKRFALSFLFGTFGSLAAAERVTWDQLRFDRTEALRGPARITVVTQAGRTVSARKFAFHADRVELWDRTNNAVRVERTEVGEVRVNRRGRYLRRVASIARFPLIAYREACCNPELMTATTAMSGVIWSYSAASAPFYLAAEGVLLVKPVRMFTIVHVPAPTSASPSTPAGRRDTPRDAPPPDTPYSSETSSQSRRP